VNLDESACSAGKFTFSKPTGKSEKSEGQKSKFSKPNRQFKAVRDLAEEGSDDSEECGDTMGHSGSADKQGLKRKHANDDDDDDDDVVDNDKIVETDRTASSVSGIDSNSGNSEPDDQLEKKLQFKSRKSGQKKFRSRRREEDEEEDNETG